MKDIRKFPRNKITIEELREYYHIEEYTALVNQVNELIEKGYIHPIKSSHLNGKKPPLYMAYRIHREKLTNASWEDEIRYLVPELNGDFYLRHLNIYGQDRKEILLLNHYFMEEKENLHRSMSVNERSFEIFAREKFLLKEGGNRILRNLGLSMEDLNCYETSQPLAYYSHKKHEGQNMLIIENKDTFYSMRKHLLEKADTIFGVPIGTLIYGGGKGIYRSLKDFGLCVEPYMRSERNQILYFGDLDYEGILIYEQVKEEMGQAYSFTPFIRAYERMVEKARDIALPDTKEKQNRNCKDEFFWHFTPGIVREMKNILESGKYIPQEILPMYEFL